MVGLLIVKGSDGRYSVIDMDSFGIGIILSRHTRAAEARAWLNGYKAALHPEAIKDWLAEGGLTR
jgi:hypothetical protein